MKQPTTHPWARWARRTPFVGTASFADATEPQVLIKYRLCMDCGLVHTRLLRERVPECSWCRSERLEAAGEDALPWR